MTFTSFEFVIFFFVMFLVTILLERYKKFAAREWVLLVGSYFFYGYWDWRFCFLLLLVTVVAYFVAKNSENTSLYVTGICVPLVVLGLFKYFNFFVNTFVEAFHIANDLTIQLILPVGISFYTFQALSYVIDVRRDKLSPESSFRKLALYISFFPQLVAGPIVKAADFLPQQYKDKYVSWNGFQDGIQIMVFGFFKKVVIADHISVFVDDVYFSPNAFSGETILFAVFAYSLQIYFDFSGYSDIAIGCAKCFGYNFRDNFNLPYVSNNVTDFWKRWHISLSSWLKEYLYISLGGNRCSKHRMYANLMMTMLLGGLWHGASWNFVFWGGLNGIMLCVDKMVGSKQRAISLVKVVATFVFITFTWIFFRAGNFEIAWIVIKRIVTWQPGLYQPFMWFFVGLSILVIASCIAVVRSKKFGMTMIEGFYPIMDLGTVKGLTFFFVEIGLVLGLAYTGSNPFVYFQF